MLYSVLQAELGIPSAHLFDREVHAKLAALRSPTAAQVCARAQLALDADPALASTVARGETSALWILNGGHYMVLEANFEERVLYGANSYLDSGGSYNRALDIVGMRALPLFKAVLDLYLASTSAKGASSTLPWRYTRKLLVRQLDGYTCSLVSALNGVAIDAGDTEQKVLNPYQLGGLRDATILLLVNYLMAAAAAEKVRRIMFSNNRFDL